MYEYEQKKAGATIQCSKRFTKKDERMFKDPDGTFGLSLSSYFMSTSGMSHPDGGQAHHIIPRSVVEDKFGIGGTVGVSFNQNKNIIYLPGCPKSNYTAGADQTDDNVKNPMSSHPDLPFHLKNESKRDHHTYSNKVKSLIGSKNQTQALEYADGTLRNKIEGMNEGDCLDDMT